MTPPPEVVSAVYNAATGRIQVNASEAVTLLDGSTAPWSVMFDAVNQPVTNVQQSGAGVMIFTSTGGGGDIRLSYAGGAFVQGDVSGLFLQPVTDFPVTS